MRSLKSLRLFGRLFGLLAAFALIAPACATTAPTVETSAGPRFHAAAADVAPDAAYRAAGLIVLMDTAVANTTPAVSRYAFIGRQNTLGMQLVTTGTLVGAWKIEVSCSPTAVDTLNPAPSSSSVRPIITAVNDDPSDITSAFTPSIAAVSAASSQYVQASPLNAGYVRATFTATSGSGQARVNFRN